MHQQLTQRLEKLKSEYASGEQMLADLEARQRALRETLLRISGAIQVLEEELAQGEEAEAPVQAA
jgi:predicted nuclease with TOPRIM domain